MLKADYDHACKELKERRLMIENLRKEKEMLFDLAQNQIEIIKFVNKVMFETTKHQRSLPIKEQNSELLDLAWSTNDVLSNEKNQSIIELLKSRGIDITFKNKGD